MLNIGSLVVNSLDYIFIVDKNYRIIYNTRYDRKLNDADGEYSPDDFLNRNYLEVYPGFNIENSSVIKCVETGEIIVNKRQEYFDYTGRRYVTNNVTFPLTRKGELIAVVELAMDVDEKGDGSQEADNRKFDEFVLKLKRDAGLITFETILTENPQVKASIETAKLLATLPNPTLIYGETGTGKELFAQSMINYSGVPKKNVVIQNCAAVPENLMEAILFGTVRGAYTGAENRPGLFEQADGGVLFLDELNSIPYNVQSKLLRVLQDGTFRPLGGSADKHVDVKVIAAMNVDPMEAIEANVIRKDLFYRFSGGLITLPPLRSRKEDIKMFIRHYTDYFGKIYNKEIEGVSEEVRKIFMEYYWEGNVRELSNVIESMVAAAEKPLLTEDLIPRYVLDRMNSAEPQERVKYDPGRLDELIGESAGGSHIEYYAVLEAVERRMIENALRQTKGNKSRAADLLGIPRKTLEYRIKKLEISRPEIPR